MWRVGRGADGCCGREARLRFHQSETAALLEDAAPLVAEFFGIVVICRELKGANDKLSGIVGA